MSTQPGQPESRIAATPLHEAGRSDAEVGEAPPTGGGRSHSAVLDFLFGRLGWLLAGLLLLTIGYLLSWQRGFYQDDYANRTQVVDVVTGKVTPIWSSENIPGFPVRAMAWALNRQLAVWMPEYEFPARATLAGFTGLNALLLGWLIRRMLRSTLPAVIVGWLSLTPLFSHDAVLWAGAASYVVTFTLMLLAIHALMHALVAKNRLALFGWTLCGAAPFLFCLLFFEQPALLIGILPFAAVALARYEAGLSGKAVLLRSLWILLGLGVVSVAYGALVYPHSNMVSSRGGLDLEPERVAAHVREFLQYRVKWMVCSRWSQALFEDVLALGFHALAASGLRLLLGAAAVMAVLLTGLKWAPPHQPTPSRREVGLLAGITIAGGLFLFLVTLLLPGVLVRGQILEYRMLYLPHAAVCLVVGALAWGVVTITRSTVAARLALTACGILSFCYAVQMLGFCEAFSKRYKLDQAHLSQLTEALPAKCLPANAVLVPMMLDQHLPGAGDSISKLLFGSFESDFTAHAELQKAYARRDLSAIVMNRWHGVVFDIPSDEASLSSGISIQGESVPVDRTIPFVHHEGRIAFVERVTVQRRDQPARTIEFPAVDAIHPTSAAKIHLTVPAGRSLYRTTDKGVSVSVSEAPVGAMANLAGLPGARNDEGDRRLTARGRPQHNLQLD